MKYRTPFFNRKRLILVGVSVLTGYIGIWGAVLMSEQIDLKRKKHAITEQKNKFEAQKPEEKAIIRAEEYIKNTPSSIKAEQQLIVDYLQRKFDLNESLGVTKMPILIHESPITYPQEIHFLARIAYPDRLVTIGPKSIVDGPSLTNIYSANCDHLALPKNFWPTMKQNYNTGGYYLTHVALGLALMKDNGCAIPASEDNLLPKTIDEMFKIADDPKTNPDLRYEAIAFLGLSGRNDLISSEWINKIISEQKDNGGWTDDLYPRESDHTTVLALWALLEYVHPDVPYEPMIRRSTQQP